VIELVDHGGEPALEADAHLDLAAEPQIVVDDIAKQPADDAGDGKANGGDDRRGLLRAVRGAVLGVIGERPVAAAEGGVRVIAGAGCSSEAARVVTAPCSLAISSLPASRGSRSATANSERSSLASISVPSS
jgi:hypothetical protein